MKTNTGTSEEIIRLTAVQTETQQNIVPENEQNNNNKNKENSPPATTCCEGGTGDAIDMDGNDDCCTIL